MGLGEGLGLEGSGLEGLFARGVGGILLMLWVWAEGTRCR